MKQLPIFAGVCNGDFVHFRAYRAAIDKNYAPATAAAIAADPCLRAQVLGMLAPFPRPPFKRKGGGR